MNSWLNKNWRVEQEQKCIIIRHTHLEAYEESEKNDTAFGSERMPKSARVEKCTAHYLGWNTVHWPNSLVVGNARLLDVTGNLTET